MGARLFKNPTERPVNYCPDSNAKLSEIQSRFTQRWLESGDSRLTQEGVFILKAQRHRTQEANRVDAWARLYEALDQYAKPPKPRKTTKPTYGSVQRRLEGKAMQSRLKADRKSETGV